MKRWVLPATATAPHELRLEDVPVPVPGPDQVRLRVAALSLNALDQMIVRGQLGRHLATQSSVRGVAVGSLQLHRDLTSSMGEHGLHPIVHAVLDFDDLPAAFDRHADADVFGKVALAL